MEQTPFDGCVSGVRHSRDSGGGPRRFIESSAHISGDQPGLTVFPSSGHSLPGVLYEHGRRPLAETSYGLLAPFLNGFLEAARYRTRGVDGHARAHASWNRGTSTKQGSSSQRSSGSSWGPRRYRERSRLGFGLRSQLAGGAADGAARSSATHLLGGGAPGRPRADSPIPECWRFAGRWRPARRAVLRNADAAGTMMGEPR
jgi:hypothetical protein